MRNRRTLRRLLQHSITCLPANSRTYMNYFGEYAPGFVGSKAGVSKLKDYRDSSAFDADFSAVMFPPTPSAQVCAVTDDFVSLASSEFSESDFLTPSLSNFDMIVGMSKALRNPNSYFNMQPYIGQETISQTLFASRLDPHVGQCLLDNAPFSGNETVLHEVVLHTNFLRGTLGAGVFPGSPLVDSKMEAVFSHGGANIFSLDPYFAIRDEEYGSSRLFLASSVLEYDENLPPVRYSGVEVGGGGSFSGTEYDYELLSVKHQYSLGEPFPNRACYMLVLSNEHRPWMNVPVVIFRGGSRVASMSAMFKGGYVSRGFHRIGFSPSSELEARTNSIPNVRTSNVISITSPKSSGSATPARYVVEKRLLNVVNFTLTNHLPLTNDDGSASEYFGPKGTFLGASHNYSEDCNRRACLQPVAFPWCQQKDSLDLYFVSLDDNHHYWLNRMRIGSVNAGETLYRLAFPPTEMLAANNLVYMAYDDGVHVYNPTLKTMTLLTIADGLLNNRVVALAQDETTGKVWFGHASGGLTNYTDNLRYSTETFTNSLPEQLEVAPQSLTVLNNIVVWLSGQTNFYSPSNMLMRSNFSIFDSVSGNYSHSSWEDISDTYVDTPFNVIYGVSLRSNSQVIVVRDIENTSSRLVGVSVYNYKLQGRNEANSLKLFIGSDKFNLNLDAENVEGSYTYRLVKLIRVTDSKFVTGAIPNNSKYTQSQFDSSQMRNVSDRYRKTSVYREIQINDERTRIEFDPYMCNSQSYHLTKFPQSGAPENIDPINSHDFTGNMFPENSLSVRDVDFEHCVRSFGVIRYGNSFAPMFAGFHIVGHGGLLQDYRDNAWVPHQSGSLVSKATHLDFQSIGNVDVKFTDRNYRTNEVYRVDCFPSRSLASDLITYLGDYEIVTHTVTLTQPTFDAPEKKLVEFQGVDAERYCVVTRNSATLTRVSGVPSPGQYMVSKAGVFTLNPADIGLVTFSYLVVKAVL